MAVLGRLAFGEIISGRDLVAGPLGTGTMLAGTAWLHLTAAGGERGPARWAKPAVVTFVGFAVMAGNGTDSVVFGVVGGLLLAAFAVWVTPRFAGPARRGENPRRR